MFTKHCLGILIEEYLHILAVPGGLVATRFDVYKDEDSPVIYDIDEERSLQYSRKPSVHDNISMDRNRQYGGINLMRKYFMLLLSNLQFIYLLLTRIKPME